MRLFTLTAVIVASTAGFDLVWAGSPPADEPAREGVTLMGILSEWKYPGSQMLGGASMSDGGNPNVPSLKCQAILTTPDSVEKVAAFYAKQLNDSRTAGAQKDAGGVKGTNAKSVSTQDDSQGRPVRIRILVVNKAETSTTLVISRAEDEQETHIAWSHYLRLESK